MNKKGKLYGIGVGPGDPELLTLKAARLIRECDLVVLPVSDKNMTQSTRCFCEEMLLRKEVPSEEEKCLWMYFQRCTAYQIAVQAVPELREKECLFLPMPMLKEKERLRKIHAEGAKAVAELLEQGKNIVFLTLGDPTVYSTCMYVEQMVETDGYPVETVPGIPSFCAVAARRNQPLGEQEEQIHILPGAYEIEDSLELPGTKILMKTGSRMKQVKDLLKESGQEVCMIENCGMEKERIFSSAEEIPDDVGYYSLLIVKEKKRKQTERRK